MMLDRDLFDFFEHAADAVFTVTDSGEICSWNTSAAKLFGFERDEALGKTCFQLFQGRDVLGTLVSTEHCHLRDCAKPRTAVPDFDLEVNTRSGRRLWVNLSTMIHEDPKTGRCRIGTPRSRCGRSEANGGARPTDALRVEGARRNGR